MKIIAVDTAYICVPLKRPFKTARREALHAQGILVRVVDENGVCGYGEAAPTPAVTGETTEGLTAAINLHLAKAIIGRDTEELNAVLRDMYTCILHNTSAKAAIDVALYDLKCREQNVSLRQYLGGGVNTVDTCITISLDTPEQMAADSISAISSGFQALKLKLGGSSETDIARVLAVRAAAGADCTLIADANQSWSAKQAVHIITQIEDMGLNIALFEQPVLAWNLDALKYVTRNVLTRIVADESVFSHHDAVRVLGTDSADMINIKLMKAGGLYGALQLCETASAFGKECMIGCMLETGLAVNAAAQLAAARPCITVRDLDAPFLCSEYNYGGAVFEKGEIILPFGAGTACDASAFFEDY